MSNSLGFSNFRILLLFCSILSWSCNKENIAKPEFGSTCCYKVHFVNQNIVFSVLNNDDVDEFEWSCKPKGAAKLQVFDKVYCSIIPTKPGKLKISVIGRKNESCSGSTSMDLNIVENLNASYYIDPSTSDTVKIAYMDLKYLLVKGMNNYRIPDDYFFYAYKTINLNNSEILTFSIGPGVSYKNGTPTYTIDTKNGTLSYKHCTYYGVEQCRYGFWKKI
jgi:hypothetical protein